MADMTEQELQPILLANYNVLNEVRGEMRRQLEKWGDQKRHPDGTGAQYGPDADTARDDCDRAFEGGVGTWADILNEEFYEALAEEDVNRLRAELIQVAAVACSWVSAIDRR